MPGVQHQEFYRKLLLRKRLSRWAEPGPAYVPFIGDGDIAAELYADRTIYGADLDPARVAIAKERLAGEIRLADCEAWPFEGLADEVCLADFDAYLYPYASFRSFWAQAPKRKRLVMFFTDGERQSLSRKLGQYTTPDGVAHQIDDPLVRHSIHSAYYSKTIFPWFVEAIAPWRVLEHHRYLRGWMLYWGAAIEAP